MPRSASGEPTTADSSTAEASGSEPLLSIRSIAKRFGSTMVLRDVSLDVAPGGSYWPLLATRIVAVTGRPTIFVPCALSATSMAQWQPGADHQDRTTLYGSMVYRINQVKALNPISELKRPR